MRGKSNRNANEKPQMAKGDTPNGVPPGGLRPRLVLAGNAVRAVQAPCFFEWADAEDARGPRGVGAPDAGRHHNSSTEPPPGGSRPGRLLVVVPLNASPWPQHP